MVVRWIWVWREGTCIQPKALQALRCSRAPAAMPSCLQHWQSQQKLARRTGHRHSTPKSLDHSSNKAAHCPTEMLLYLLPQCSYSCPTAQHHFPIPVVGSKESSLSPNLPRPLTPSSGPSCPFGLQSKTMGSATATGSRASCKEQSLLPGTACKLISLCAQDKEQPNSRRSLTTHRLARASPKPLASLSQKQQCQQRNVSPCPVAPSSNWSD